MLSPLDRLFFYTDTLSIQTVVHGGTHMSTKHSVQRINDKHFRVYSDILRMEEEESRKRLFRDRCIKEMHTIDAIGILATQC